VADHIVARWDNLDILFNNAVLASAGPPSTYTISEWDRAMVTNSTALYRCCKVFSDIMVRHRSGSIVNVGSIYGVVSPDFRIYQGLESMTNPPSYGFAKAGMIQLTRYLATWLAPHGIRVNCLSPGGLHETEMAAEFVDRYCVRTPLGRMAGCNDIKGAAVLLASDASSYITGQNLIVDGGLASV
jgi:NAD(P)-dependent dehydrogenase (short-subunit alcohol dehydrogenase family)